ncbi:MAG: urea ABC transporter substrate-binding protein [Thalassospira sp.]|uniref:urea ABC transporter substrate-binding protein n=1 Tax=Thalassospira sp. TaxID=1912094 RepID=UPI003A874F12
MRKLLRLVAWAVTLIFTMLGTSYAQTSEPIKIGVLHSLSGTMAISETTLKDTVLMMVEAQNRRGGLLGRQLEAVVMDPASDWPTFAQQTRTLIEDEGVAVIFGCWTSASRKAVLPVLEELDGLLYYPVQYEGQESSRNIFYTGAAPNQQAIPAADYLMREDAVGATRMILLGTDYVYPRTTNKLMRSYLNSRGISNADILEIYTPFGHSDWQDIITQMAAFANQGKKTAVISTLNGDTNISFYQELARQGITAQQMPVMAFSVGEQELSRLDTMGLVGHMAAWNYFMSVEAVENSRFIQNWQEYTKDPSRLTNDPMEATCIGFKMWAQAVEQAETTEVRAVRQAMYGQKVRNLTGGTAVMLNNHHISKPVLVGQIQADGQFVVIWNTNGEVRGDAWSDYLPESAGLTADWTYPWLCGGCKTPKYADE